eukprot:Unigene6280_Nuclearia_a/m.19333 Unigene6280_Nuclearia_a/g.19333  ORF Unigene6280_Nuclearia_a/g.19333 Unigene6280_Nuclearia_a/m.19333 type:complete len:489 (+) Unigene6280_Nuclearia_a:47-1513(+)
MSRRALASDGPHDGPELLPRKRLCGGDELPPADEPPFLLPNNARLLAKTPPCTRLFMEEAWRQFTRWDDTTRKVFLDGIMTRCEWPQLPYTSNLIKGLLRVDFIGVLPSEIAYQILSHLNATSLCRACQVSKTWKRLAEDRQIWLRMCRQHIGHRCRNCGWGLPTNAIEFAPGAIVHNPKRLYAEKHIIARNWRAGKHRSYTLCGHADGVICLQYDERERKIVSGSYDHTIRVWDLDKRECVKVLKGHELSVQALQFNECMIVSGSMDKTVRIWCSRTGRLMRTLEHSEGVLALSFDCRRIVSGTVDGAVRVWELLTNSHYSLVGHMDRINCVKLYQDNMLFSASDDMTVCLWDLTSRECIRKFVGHTAQVQCLQARDGRLVTGSLDNTLKMWDIETGRCIKTLFGHVEGVWCLAFDSLRIISGAHDRTLKIWDVDDATDGESPVSGQPTQSFLVHEGPINCAALSEALIVTGSDDRCIRVWDFGAHP